MFERNPPPSSLWCFYTLKSLVKLFFLLLLLPYACQDDPDSGQDRPTSAAKAKVKPDPIDSRVSQLLYFKKEQALELWAEDKLVLQCDFFPDFDLPIGLFELQSIDDQLVLNSSNDYYHLKYGKDLKEEHMMILFKNKTDCKGQILQYQPSRIYIFPNDARNEGPFAPCFACPHWTAELYSFLQLHLKAFPKSKS